MSPAPVRTGLRHTDVRVLALTIGNGAVIVLAQASGIVLSRLFNLEDYATYRQTFLAFDFVAPLFLLGLPNAVLYQLSRARGGERSVVANALAVASLSALIFSIGLAAGGADLLALRFDNPALSRYLRWLPVYALAFLPAAILPSVLVWANAPRQAAAFRVVGSISMALLVIVATVAGTGVGGAVAARVIAAVLVLPLGLWMVHRLDLRGRLRPDRGAAARLVKLALPLGLAGAVGTVAVQLHSVIVAFLTTPQDFAIYINGAVEHPIVGVLTGSIAAVVLVDMSDAFAAGDKPKALGIFRDAAERSALVLLPTVACCLVVAKDLMVTLYSTKYTASTLPFAIYLFVLPARIVVFGAALTAAGRMRELFWRSVGDLVVNSIACYALVAAFGYNGAALGLVVTLYCWTVPFNLRRIIAAYDCGIREVLPWGALGRILACAVFAMLPAGASHELLGAVPPYARLIADSLVYSGALLVAYRVAGIARGPAAFMARVLGSRRSPREAYAPA